MTNTNQNRKEPSAEELAALRTYAAEHGRHWKEALWASWMNGGDHLRQSDGAALQRLRNRLGPSWLAQYRLPDAT